MKKLTKALLSLFALVILFTALNSCQEDVYPDLIKTEVTTIDDVDVKPETNDGGEDEGIDPK